MIMSCIRVMHYRHTQNREQRKRKGRERRRVQLVAGRVKVRKRTGANKSPLRRVEWEGRKEGRWGSALGGADKRLL